MEEGYRIRRVVTEEGEDYYEVYQLADPLGRDQNGNRSAIAKVYSIREAVELLEKMRHADESEEVPG